MIKISIATNAGDLARRMTDLHRRKIPWATKKALDATAQDVAEALKLEMRSVFHNPVPWTVESVRYWPATYASQRNGFAARPARVGWKDEDHPSSAARYLRPQVEGGPRHHTPFESRLIRGGWLRANEYLVPARFAERDARGNLNPGQLTKILTDLGTIDTARHARGKVARSTRKRAGEVYYVDRTGGAGTFFDRKTAHAPRGIYLNRGSKRRLLVFVIVQQPSYAAIFDMRGVAQRVVRSAFARHFRRELDKAVTESVARRRKAA